MTACANCGKENPAEAQFCMTCGTPLASEAAPRETRKTVTVVFCDVTGSTALGEKLDPESLRKVMGRYFEEMKTVLERHGATVEKFIGDAVMAVFGVPQVHEDDALRAVRAAAEMREVLAELNKDLERDWGVTIASRIGVNTGEVVAGDPSSGQALVTGDAVNVAARLEQTASPGEVLIGQDTYRLVRDAVEAEPVEPLALKGKADLVRAHRLLEVLPETPAYTRHFDSPMVGRERQLRMVSEAFDAAVSDRACHLFTILGPAGVGKSRLVEEFLGTLRDTTVLRGRCLPYGEGITYFPVIEVVKQAAGLADFDAPEVVEAKVCAVLEGDEHQEIVCKRVAQLLGITEGAAPEETFWAIRTMLEAVARARPLLLVFDDVHWGEPTFLDLVEHVADLSRDAPILLACTARPDLLDARPAWAGGKPNAATISLEPLSENECSTLVANLLGTTELPAEAGERIQQAAEGNPLFVEEMLSMLIDDGLLTRDDGRWVAAPDLSLVSVPPTITALLAARLDRLAAEERAVIERASVVGKVFYRGAVLELSPEELRPEIGRLLTSLVRKELVRPDRSTLPGEDAFRFRHMLIRDAAYEAMPKELRAELHERFANWLEWVAGDRIAEQEEILGYHLEQSHRYRAELRAQDERDRELGARAATRLASAGRRALARGDVGGGANLVERAASLLPPTASERLELQIDLGTALRDLGEFERAGALLEEVISEAEQAGDRRLRARVVVERAFGQVNTDPQIRMEAIARAIRSAVPVFEELSDQRGLAQAISYLATLELWLGRAGAAEALFERAVGSAEIAGDQRVATDLLRWFLAAGGIGPTPVPEVLQRCDEIVERAEGQRRVLAWALWARGMSEAMLGRFEEAREHSRQAVDILEDLGLHVEVSAISAYALGTIETLAGDHASAERALREGYEGLAALRETGHLSSIAAMLGEALYALGRYDEARSLSEASERAAAADDVESQMCWRGVRAKTLAREGSIKAAEELAQQAVELARSTDFVNHLGNRLLDLAEVLRLTGRPNEAVAAVQEALRLYKQKGNIVSADKARALLQEIAAGAV